MIEYLILGLGLFLSLSGAALVIARRETAHSAMMVALGVICCLVVGGISNLTFKVAGQEATVTLKDVKLQVAEAKLDLKAEDTAPINLQLEKIGDALQKQEKFNGAVTARLDALAPPSTSAGSPPPPLNRPNINTPPPTFTANNDYSVIVFFRDSRRDDSELIVKSLLAAGFQASSINTSLDEVALGEQPGGSTYILPTPRGATVGEAVLKTARASIPPPRNGAITLGSAYKLRRGDVQIYLY